MVCAARQQDGAVVMGGGEVRIEGDGAVEAFQRLPLPPDGLKRGTQIGVSSGILKRKSYRLAGVSERFFATPQGCQRGSPGSVSTGKIAIERQRAITGLQRFLRAAGRVERLGEIQPDARAIGLDLQGSGEEHDAIGLAPELS